MCFVTGMLMGIITKNDDALGGYTGRSRRYVRLGHIACGALGMISILAGLSSQAGFLFTPAALFLLLVGLVSMPLACWFNAFNLKLFPLFAVPSASLIAATVLVVRNF